MYSRLLIAFLWEKHMLCSFCTNFQSHFYNLSNKIFLSDFLPNFFLLKKKLSVGFFDSFLYFFQYFAFHDQWTPVWLVTLKHRET